MRLEEEGESTDDVSLTEKIKDEGEYYEVAITAAKSTVQRLDEAVAQLVIDDTTKQNLVKKEIPLDPVTNAKAVLLDTFRVKERNTEVLIELEAAANEADKLYSKTMENKEQDSEPPSLSLRL